MLYSSLGALLKSGRLGGLAPNTLALDKQYERVLIVSIRFRIEIPKRQTVGNPLKGDMFLNTVCTYSDGKELWK